MAIVVYSFRYYNEKALTTFVSNCIDLMSADSIFAPLAADIQELKTRYTAYCAAESEATKGGRDRTLEKNRLKTAMVEQMTLVAQNVNILAQGDEAIIIRAGLLSRKAKKHKPPVTELTVPTSVIVTNDDRSGVLHIKWDEDPNAVNYAIEHKIDGEPSWVNGKYSTTPKDTLLTGYPAGKYVNFRVRKLGMTNVESDWCSPVGIWVS